MRRSEFNFVGDGKFFVLLVFFQVVVFIRFVRIQSSFFVFFLRILHSSSNNTRIILVVVLLLSLHLFFPSSFSSFTSLFFLLLFSIMLLLFAPETSAKSHHRRHIHLFLFLFEVVVPTLKPVRIRRIRRICCCVCRSTEQRVFLLSFLSHRGHFLLFQSFQSDAI